MSINVITNVSKNGVPRLKTSDTVTVVANEWNSTYLEKEFFCPEGHSFSIIFDTTQVKEILPIWECEECETIALDFPPDSVESQ